MTTTTRPAPAAAGATFPSTGRLIAVHLRHQFLETVRVPVAVIGTTVFPAASLLFFVVPQPHAHDRVPATVATTQLAVFAVMSVCLFTYGVGVSQDRALPWDPYLRTLPAGPVPRLVARLGNGLAFGLIGLAPLFLIAATLTAASLPPARLLLASGALALAALPLLGAGLAIGYALAPKAALAVAQVLLLPMAFAGGLFLPPEEFPRWLDAASGWLPTRAGRDLVVQAATGSGMTVTSVPVLAGWAALTAALAVRAYRRDEGLRFR